MKYCVFLDPGEEISGFVQALRRREEFLEKSTPPHLTLRESFYTSRVDDVVDWIRNQEFRRLTIELQEFGVFAHNNLVLKAQNSPQLQEMHERIMQYTQPLVKGIDLFGPDEELTSRQKELLREYNNPYSFEFYNPHITIARMRKNIFPGPINLSFKAREIVVFNQTKKSDYARIGLSN